MKKRIGIIIAAMLAILIGSLAAAEEEGTSVWVMCQPESYVNIRERPGSRSPVLGRYEAGTRLTTDGKTKNGYLHLIHLTLESEEGWIHGGYIVYGEPEEKNATYEIRSNGRVAARKTIDGKRRRWMRNGDRVTVYRASRVWAVTNRGFIQTRYLKEVEEP